MTEVTGLVMRRDERLARHTALRTGGPCAVWVVAHDEAALVAALARLRAENLDVAVLGAGTRTVVRDGGVAGAVLRLGTGFARIGVDGLEVVVGAAVPVPALVATAAAHDLGGLEEHARTPGSVGASLALDDSWEGLVTEVGYAWRGKPRRGSLAEARARRSAVITSVTLRLLRQTDAAARVQSAWLVGPTPVASWYRPPPRTGVRDLVGPISPNDVRLRQVALPSVAPELLVNLGEATAADLALMHRSVLDRVQRLRGVELGSRMRWLGVAPASTLLS